MMNSNEMKREHFGRKGWVKMPFFILAMVLVKSAIVFYLWNDLVPNLFHGPTLTYLNALELIVLAKFLMGGLGGGGFGAFRGRFGHHRHHHMHHAHHGHEHRWDGLSAEEREALREMIRERGER